MESGTHVKSVKITLNIFAVHTTVLWKAERNLHGLGLRSKMALGLNLPIKCLPPTEIPMSR